MGYGMSYDEYWNQDCWRTKYYREAFKIQMKRLDEGFWMQGMYVYEAIGDMAPILHPFSKSGTKPLPYREHPYTSDVMKIEESKEEKEKMEKQKAENERLIARLHFEKWMRDTAKRFNK